MNERRDRDSNPGNAFDVYTLSRRASSATRASLLAIAGAKVIILSEKWRVKKEEFASATAVLTFFLILAGQTRG